MRLVYSRLPSTRLCDQVERLALIVGEVAIELDVLLVLDLGLGTRPQRRAAVDGLVFERRRALLRHAHREGDVIGIAPHQRTQAPGIEELLRILLEVQHDGGAALGPLHGLHGELAVGGRFPAHALAGGQARRGGVSTSTRSATMKAE